MNLSQRQIEALREAARRSKPAPMGQALIAAAGLTVDDLYIDSEAGLVYFDTDRGVVVSALSADALALAGLLH